MQFYKCIGTITNKSVLDRMDDRRELSNIRRALCFACNGINDPDSDSNYIFASEITEELATLTFGAVVVDRKALDKKMKAFVNAVGLGLEDIQAEETTFGDFRSLLRNASRVGMISDDDEVLEKLRLPDPGNYRREIRFAENLIPMTLKEDIEVIAVKYLLKETLSPEIERIYASKRPARSPGHPVFYLIETDNTDIRREAYRALLSALYANGRLANRRYSYTDVDTDEYVSLGSLNDLYCINEGGALVVRMDNAEETMEGEYASSERELMDTLAQLLKRYRNSVLTILCMPRECKKYKQLLYEKLSNVAIVEIREDLASGEDAKDYLKLLARQNKVHVDRNLFSGLEEGRGYLSAELCQKFEIWYDNKLRTSIYPQYRELTTVKKELKETKPKGSAYQELKEMIGLDSAKKVIDQALSYYKAQKLFKDKGMSVDHPAMHCVFTGSPGTAKTSTARLFAQIMKENGILSKGHLVEVGRADIVGRYVGSTAPLVKKRFQEAKGGVLFIDEAYSLVDDRDGLYGDEAISTIVQEMENCRDNTIVIFAGYTDKMEAFLNKNPGLRSRIAYHINFEDYTAEELCSITKLLAKKKGNILSEDAEEKLVGIFEEARCLPDFGNGRFARNLLEKARMAQAARLISMDYDRVSGEDIRIITAEDIEAPAGLCRAEQKTAIGFQA